MDNHTGVDYLFDVIKDQELESMSEEEGVRFYLHTEKETISFRSMTETKGVMDWFAMRKISEGGSTYTRILGESLTNLDQGNCASELEDLFGRKVRDDDVIEV